MEKAVIYKCFTLAFAFTFVVLTKAFLQYHLFIYIFIVVFKAINFIINVIVIYNKIFLLWEGKAFLLYQDWAFSCLLTDVCVAWGGEGVIVFPSLTFFL